MNKKIKVLLILSIAILAIGFLFNKKYRFLLRERKGKTCKGK